jgi:hypothetical protein
VADECFWEVREGEIKSSVSSFLLDSSFAKELVKHLPPMREKMMPDVLPRLLGLEEEIHIWKLKKIPQKFRKTHGGFWEIFLGKYLRNNTTPWGDSMVPSRRSDESGWDISCEHISIIWKSGEIANIS